MSSSVPDFSQVELATPSPRGDLASWRDALRADTGKDDDALVWETPEGIDVRPLYSTAGGRVMDLAAMNGGDADYDITWPHWAPGDSADYYWVVFASERDYGHKVTRTNTAASCVANGVTQCKQIWIGAISKAALASGAVDPSAPPMWLPGQNYQTNNISPYWTAGVPIN